MYFIISSVCTTVVQCATVHTLTDGYSVCTHVFGTSRNVLSLLFTSSNIKFLLQSAAKREGERGQRVTGRGGEQHLLVSVTLKNKVLLLYFLCATHIFLASYFML